MKRRIHEFEFRDFNAILFLADKHGIEGTYQIYSWRMLGTSHSGNRYDPAINRPLLLRKRSPLNVWSSGSNHRAYHSESMLKKSILNHVIIRCSSSKIQSTGLGSLFMTRLNDVYRCLASNDSISIATFDSSELPASPAAPWMKEKEIIYLVPNGSTSVFSCKTLRMFFWILHWRQINICLLSHLLTFRGSP